MSKPEGWDIVDGAPPDDSQLPDWLEGAIQRPLYGGQYNREQMLDAIEALVNSRHPLYSRSVAEQILELFHENPPRSATMNFGDAEKLYWGDGVYGLKLTGTTHAAPGRFCEREFVLFFGKGEEARFARSEVRWALDTQDIEYAERSKEGS